MLGYNDSLKSLFMSHIPRWNTYWLYLTQPGKPARLSCTASLQSCQVLVENSQLALETNILIIIGLWQKKFFWVLWIWE